MGGKTGLQQVDERSKRKGALPLFTDDAEYRKQFPWIHLSNANKRTISISQPMTVFLYSNED